MKTKKMKTKTEMKRRRMNVEPEVGCGVEVKDRADRDHHPSQDVKMRSILHVHIVFLSPFLLPLLLPLFGCRARSMDAAFARTGCPSLLLGLCVVAPPPDFAPRRRIEMKR